MLIILRKHTKHAKFWAKGALPPKMKSWPVIIPQLLLVLYGLQQRILHMEIRRNKQLNTTKEGIIAIYVQHIQYLTLGILSMWEFLSYLTHWTLRAGIPVHAYV